MWIEATYWTMQLQITKPTLNNLLSEVYSNFITRQHTIFFLNKVRVRKAGKMTIRKISGWLEHHTQLPLPINRSSLSEGLLKTFSFNYLTSPHRIIVRIK